MSDLYSFLHPHLASMKSEEQGYHLAYVELNITPLQLSSETMSHLPRTVLPPRGFPMKIVRTMSTSPNIVDNFLKRFYGFL